ncbi:MAG: hypothetical protein ACYCW6_14875 [Candidatus Xenobia bacterium]
MFTTLKRLGLCVLATTAGIALFTGCGNNNTTTPLLPFPTPTPPAHGTSAIVFLRSGAGVQAIPFNTTTGAFGTATATGTQAAATSFVNAPNVPFAFTIESGVLNEYSVNTQTGALTNLAGAPTLASPGTEVETNGTGNELFVGETNNSIESFAVNLGTGAAAHLAAPTGSLTATTGAAITSSQVVAVGTAQILVVTENNGNVQSFLLNSDGSFANAGAAASTVSLGGANTSATSSATFTEDGNTFVAVTGNGTSNNLVDFQVAATGTLTQAPAAGGALGSNPATVTSTANAGATPIGIVVQPTGALNVAGQQAGLTAYVVMIDGAIEAVPVLTDGTFGAPRQQATGVTGNLQVVTAGNVVTGFGNTGFFVANNAIGGLQFFNTSTGTATAGTPFVAAGFGSPVTSTQTF